MLLPTKILFKVYLPCQNGFQQLTKYKENSSGQKLKGNMTIFFQIKT